MAKHNFSKWMFWSLISFLLTVNSVHAAAGKSTAAIPNASSSATFLNVGAGMAFFRGNTGWALNFGGIRQISPGSPIFVGADLGLNFWSYGASIGGVGSLAAGSTALQLLPTAIYRFSIASMRSVYPYVGLSIGPNLFFEREVVSSGATVRGGGTSLYFEALLRPGVYTNLSDSVALNIEPKFGFLASELVFLPQVSAVFTL